eukprot:CAMPEP_0201703842 /NCGR_PEP_ID=MMETSP0578-20130828/40970_1 /ASSEMBLY_ACC=CAM_ASM_000663 /TAXON_ID=267565 /ORGANISM="Skeletonema grethea, Strain CCMP 1804" /LENGTH=347 /DNA_ID=CAMNT_0048191737 /DNA_START=87 /DNA_END=1130 /DNA_ORIENTATION=+
MTSSSPPHVVQSILEQFTKCFNPTSETDGIGSSGGKAPSISPRSSQHGRTSPFERLQDALRDSKHRRSGSGNSSGTSKSLDDSKRSQGSDVVAKAKKAVSIPSPEILEEKSYKRKLEIFRTRGSPDVDRQRAKMSNDLVEDPPSDISDEEIKNLMRRNRFACGMNMGPINESKPIATFAKFFSIGQDGSPNPFGLCFATPVRAASPEDVDTLSDDCLTTEEFLDRHARSSSPDAPDLVKDSLRGSDSISEDGEKTVETVNSTLYFESKYNNFTQTSPPMPLFASQSISVTPSKTNEISEMIKKRHEEHLKSKRRVARRNISPQKRSTKSHHPSSPNSVADTQKLAEI